MFNRVFTEQRQAQGCAECQKPGRAILLDDGWQPTLNRCAEAVRLQAISDGR